MNRARTISIHAPRTGSDSPPSRRPPSAQYFNPRSPHGERRHLRAAGRCADKHFNPRSPHGERQGNRRRGRCLIWISIHAPRTGSDVPNQAGFTGGKKISIHAPRTGSDHSDKEEQRHAGFQSTLPARGATNPPDDGPAARAISIHAPRTGSDFSVRVRQKSKYQFQSTLPARGATGYVTTLLNSDDTFQSTLPARGATQDDIRATLEHCDFNPRSPHGERLRPERRIT